MTQSGRINNLNYLEEIVIHSGQSSFTKMVFLRLVESQAKNRALIWVGELVHNDGILTKHNLLGTLVGGRRGIEQLVH